MRRQVSPTLIGLSCRSHDPITRIPEEAMSTRRIFEKPALNNTTGFPGGTMAISHRRQWSLCLLLALALSGCAGTSGSSVRYDPFRCDRNGDESQRRSC